MAQGQEIPNLPGAYALLINLAYPVALPIAPLGRLTLAAGLYVYCGSARGPGGLAARVGRHLRREKRLHWHVDYVTSQGRIDDVSYLLGQGECYIVDCLGRAMGVSFPIPGFGSSDCQQCPAHLLNVPNGFVLSPNLLM